MSWWIVTLLVVAGAGAIGLGLYLGLRSSDSEDAPDDIYPMW